MAEGCSSHRGTMSGHLARPCGRKQKRPVSEQSHERTEQSCRPVPRDRGNRWLLLLAIPQPLGQIGVCVPTSNARQRLELRNVCSQRFLFMGRSRQDRCESSRYADRSLANSQSGHRRMPPIANGVRLRKNAGRTCLLKIAS